MSVCLHDRTTPQRRAGIFRLAPFAVEWRHAASRASVNSRAFSIRLGLRHPRTEVRLTHRWREMDSNFQYASTVRWHRSDLALPPTVKRRKTRDDTFRNRKFVDSPLEGSGFELPVREHRAMAPSHGFAAAS